MPFRVWQHEVATKAAGVLFVKVHDTFQQQLGLFTAFAERSAADLAKDRELFFALLREARQVGLPVVGHLHAGVTSVEAAETGAGWCRRCRPSTRRHDLIRLSDRYWLESTRSAASGNAQSGDFFNATDSLGTVTAGKLADLVLFDGDPLADIENVMKLWGVVANGRYFDRATLGRMAPSTQPGWRTSPGCG